MFHYILFYSLFICSSIILKFSQSDLDIRSCAATAMKNQIIIILGQLGPPDLLTIDHGTFPNRPGDPLKECGSDICNLKLRYTIN